MIDAIFSQFVKATPITVMVRGIMERIFEPTALDELFETHAVQQYTRERTCPHLLLFSNVVGLMSLVVSGIHPSVSAAYKALEKDLGVSRPALYGKLNGMELGVSQALVRYSASNLGVAGLRYDYLTCDRLLEKSSPNLPTPDSLSSILKCFCSI